MRNLATVLLALGTAACANVHETPSTDGVYTLIIPGDTLSSAQTMDLRATERADKLCPHGWTKLDEDSLPSDDVWTIRCQPVAKETTATKPAKPTPPEPAPPEPAPPEPNGATGPPVKL